MFRTNTILYVYGIADARHGRDMKEPGNMPGCPCVWEYQCCLTERLSI